MLVLCMKSPGLKLLQEFYTSVSFGVSGILCVALVHISYVLAHVFHDACTRMVDEPPGDGGRTSRMVDEPPC